MYEKNYASGTSFFSLCVKFGANPFKNGGVIAV